MGTRHDRDRALRTRADLLGLALTIFVVLFAGLLGEEWLLVPAGYWVLLLGIRLAALTRGEGAAKHR